MCGGSKQSKPAAPVNMGYTYSPADYSNVQRQKAAIDPAAGKAANYGSDLSAGGMTPQPTGVN
jgi:hypothetical protein